MSLKNNKLILIISLLIVTVGLHKPAYSQWELFNRNIVTVHSPNGNYLAKSMPYSRIQQSRWGRTEVYDVRTSTLLYTIPECLTEGTLYLSNDGMTIAHILDTEYDRDTTKYATDAVSLFRNGKVWKRYKISQLTDCDTCDNLLFSCDIVDIRNENGKTIKYYHPIENPRDTMLSNRPTYFMDDTVFIFTSNRKLVKIYLPTGAYSTDSFKSPILIKLQSAISGERQKKDFNCPKMYASNSFEHEGEALEKYLDMKATGYWERNEKKYKTYRIYGWLCIDTAGRASVVELVNRDSLPEKKVRDAIENTTWVAPKDIPDEIGCWNQKFHAAFRKSDEHVAMKEKKIELKKEREEYLQRAVADRINGVYIPKNLEDCFHTLDTLLSTKNILTIKNFNNRDETIKLHHGLGTWLRNNWGLWGGSRLQKFFLERGLKHPDDMSAAILKYYYDYLHGQNDAWRKFDAKGKKEK